MVGIRVSLGERSYDISIGSDIIKNIGNDITELNLGRKCVIITDDKVGKLYGNSLLRSLTDAGYTVGEIQLPQGEENKSLKNVERCYHTMLSLGLDRKSFVAALGGGLTGDIAGFVASTFMRGIPFIQVPTTLLADVDASIGGKTGVNLREGKNLVGTFHQPSAVFIDIDTLKTLDKRDLLSGFVEVLKHGLIRDSEFFSYLKENFDRIMEIDSRTMEAAISRSCRIKASIVEEDERESGTRALLNFGHTVGHAVESLSVEMGQAYRHGEAVAIGMAAALDLSVRLGYLNKNDMQDVLDFMSGCGLPIFSDFLNPEQIMERMKADKKIVDDKLRFVLLKDIGDAFIEDDVGYDDVLEVVKTRCGKDE